MIGKGWTESGWAEQLVVTGPGAVHNASIPGAARSQFTVKDMVNAFMEGIAILLLDAAGATTECTVSLNRELTKLSLSFSGEMDAKEQRIHLQEIDRIYLGEETAHDADLPLHDLCVKLILEDGRTVRLLFGNGDERDA